MAAPSSIEDPPAAIGDGGADAAPSISFSAAGSEGVSPATLSSSPAPRIGGTVPSRRRCVR
eukprot:9094656-Alexandrium_andersonii.AAC.1